MWRHILISIMFVICVTGHNPNPKSGEELVKIILENCEEIACLKQNVLSYLDSLLKIQSDVEKAKNIDAAIYKRVAKVMQTYRINFKLPKTLFGQMELIYDPNTGWNILPSVSEESRVIGLKKKLLFPLLLLLKLKMKLLMPVFVAVIGLKAMKALILSKLAILIVLGFVAYQLLAKAGISVPLSMMPAAMTDPPAAMYGVPNPTTAASNSYEPGWEPNQGGPYQRVWSLPNNDPQYIAYSAYQPATISSSNRPETV